jgi:hypothetical protein
MSQLHKFFTLKTPEDLLRKLERDYDRWETDPLNIDLGWNFFMTAEHLPDWVYYQDMPTSGKPRPDLLDGQTPYEFKMDRTCPLIRICSHLANEAKHFHLGNTKLTSVGDTMRDNTGYFAEGFFAKNYFARGHFREPALLVRLDHKEQTALGLSEAVMDALWLAARVLEFWRRRKIS